ncbi:MAG TPA: hypothetical protein VL737_00670 [Candidatus Pristimantibacillus sp.]|jgi:hypothetical protein|nr:hypothetical protein [Candidatus Pristimantibacillus sp.]
MGTVITGILTDARMRDAASVESALIAKAKAFTPWGGLAEEQ